MSKRLSPRAVLPARDRPSYTMAEAARYLSIPAPTIRAWFAKHPRFHVHFTPTYASWINQVERWFAGLEAKQLRRGSYTSVPVLKAAIWEYIKASNTESKPFVWTKTADQILSNIARFAQRTVQVHGGQ